MHNQTTKRKPVIIRYLYIFSTIVALAFCSVACGGPSDPVGDKWAAKDYNGKLLYMGTEVFAPLQKMFQDFDPKRFENFSCKTCHGEDGEAKKYKMTNGIYPMTEDGVDKGDAKFVAFMKEKVIPKMIELLGHKFDSTKGGVGCFGCHEKK